jgi:hypothetical protein
MDVIELPSKTYCLPAKCRQATINYFLTFIKFFSPKNDQ